MREFFHRGDIVAILDVVVKKGLAGRLAKVLDHNKASGKVRVLLLDKDTCEPQSTAYSIKENEIVKTVAASGWYER